MARMAWAALALMLAGCATTPPPPQRHHWNGGQGGHHRPDGDGSGNAGGGPGYQPRLGLFISPMGEPFRSTESKADIVARWFDAANTHHDGRLTRAEFEADADRVFSMLDRNHDGVIDPDEVRYYETEMVPEIQVGGYAGGAAPAGAGTGSHGHGGGHHGGGGGGGGGMGGGGGGGHRGGGDGGDTAGGDTGESSTSTTPAVGSYDNQLRGAGRFGLLNIPEPVSGADEDMDRSITRREWRDAADRRFAMLDGDDDGVLLRDKILALAGASRRR